MGSLHPFPGSTLTHAQRDDAKRHHTAWLNGPFELSAEDQAELDQRAERAAERTRQEAEAKAKRDAVAKEAKALGQKVRKGEAGAVDVQKAFEDLGIALPLTLKGEDICDAKGRMICTRGYSYSSNGIENDARAQAIRLIVLAANAGLAFAKTAEAEAEPPPAADPELVEDDDPDLTPALKRLAGVK